jgi:hypothetical protein
VVPLTNLSLYMTKRGAAVAAVLGFARPSKVGADATLPMNTSADTRTASRVKESEIIVGSEVGEIPVEMIAVAW